MPLSTSLNSNSGAFLASSKRSASLGPSPQATTSLSGAIAQAGSSSSLKPPGAGSMLKVTGQRLSRSEFEISQAPPTRSLAASGIWGVPCARASLAAIASADSAAKKGDMRAGLADMPKGYHAHNGGVMAAGRPVQIP